MTLHAIQVDRANRHPVDRMGDIKEQIAKLESEFADLREKVLTGDCLPTGDEWVALISEMKTRHISVKQAEKTLPAALFNSLVTASSATRVALRRIIKRGGEE